MKELSIEEKAKAYDKASKWMEGIYPTLTHEQQMEAEAFFPIFKESEDEKVRKRIISALVEWEDKCSFPGDSGDMIAWLEKQGKHAEFLSKIQVGDKVTLNEDGVLVNLTQLKRVVNKGIENAIKAKQGEQKPKVNLHVKCIVNKVEPFDKYEGLTDFERTLADICIGWIGEEPGYKQYIKDNADVLLKIAAKKFNSVQDAASEQKLAWSEEDEKMLDSFLHKLEVCDLLSNKEGIWIKNKLKALKDRVQPQSTWKPRKEQIAILELQLKNISGDSWQYAELKELLEQLKKLREE